MEKIWTMYRGSKGPQFHGATIPLQYQSSVQAFWPEGQHLTPQRESRTPDPSSIHNKVLIWRKIIKSGLLEVLSLGMTKSTAQKVSANHESWTHSIFHVWSCAFWSLQSLIDLKVNKFNSQERRIELHQIESVPRWVAIFSVGAS